MTTMTCTANAPASVPPDRLFARTLVFLLLWIVVGTGFAATQAQAEDVAYVVQPGDNPWTITERYLKGMQYWPRILEHNSIQEPRFIPPGTVLRIPLSWLHTDALSGRILGLRGEVMIDRGSESVAARPGMTVDPGATLRTGADSSVTLAFPDGTQSVIGENTELVIARLLRIKALEAQQIEIELREGQTETTVPPNRRNGDRYLIRTPAAVAAVRGTEFRAAASADRTRVETLGGEVTLGNRRGEIRLPAGVGSIAERDREPEPATPLLPAPDLSALPGRIERLPIDLPVPPVEGAVAYRTQFIAPDGPAVMESDRTVARPALVGRAELPDGRYRIRVRTIDERGFEGLVAARDIVIAARPEPPFPTHPASDGVASDEQIVFSWARNPQAIHYHFELASDPVFESLILREDSLREPALALVTGLEPGIYYWRAAVTTADDGRGPFSDPQRFRRPEPGPVPDAAVDKHRLELRWRDDQTSVRYRVQLSQSADFSAPELEFESSEAHLVIDKPPPGTHYVRIRGVEADGSVTPWSPAQIVEVPQNHWRALLLFLPLLFVL